MATSIILYTATTHRSLSLQCPNNVQQLPAASNCQTIMPAKSQ